MAADKTGGYNGDMTNEQRTNDVQKLLTEAELAAIAERADKATSGPWRLGSPFFQCLLNHGDEYHGKGKCRYTFQGWNDDNYYEIYRDIGYTEQTEDKGTEPPICGTWNFEEGGVKREEDARFIAAARQDIPALLAENRRLRKWCRQLVKLCEDYIPYEGGIDVRDVAELAGEIAEALEESQTQTSE